MGNSVKAAVITGIFSLAAGILGTMGYSAMNQNVTVNINGEQVSVKADEYQNIYDRIQQLTNENNRLKEEITDLKNSAASEENIEINEPVKSFVSKNDYLVYTIEPYSKSHYTKVIDNSIKMGGKSYNNGFKFAGTYSRGSAIFNLEGKYNTLSGLIGYTDPGDDDDVTVEFWGDDVLIDVIVVKSKALPTDFSVNLSGVKKFEIKTVESTYDSLGFAEVKIK